MKSQIKELRKQQKVNIMMSTLDNFKIKEKIASLILKSSKTKKRNYSIGLKRNQGFDYEAYHKKFDDL